jgi:HEAT repeat protein
VNSLNHTNRVSEGLDLADPAMIHSLIAALKSDDGRAREAARQGLVAIGKPAVRPLIQALDNPNHYVRWEATKALGEIGDPAAAGALVRTMEDDPRFEVRWLAAEGLITLGIDGLPPLLQALVERSDSVWLLEGARHVLHVLAREGLGPLVSPVLTALVDMEPELEVPEAASIALDKLTGAVGQSGET